MSIIAGNPGIRHAGVLRKSRPNNHLPCSSALPDRQPSGSDYFCAANPLLFGASKFLLQVGYYPREMQDDPVADCTSGCTLAIDHHNMAAWYRVIYADANSLPRSIGDPVKIPSEALY